MDHIFTILIAEGNRYVRDFLRRELGGEGYEIRLAGNSRDLLETINADIPPELLIIDLDFWQEGVLEFLNRLKNRSPALPVVVHTLATEMADHPAVKNAVEAFIEKRGNPATLKNAVAQALRKNYPLHFSPAGLPARIEDSGHDSN